MWTSWNNIKIKVFNLRTRQWEETRLSPRVIGITAVAMLVLLAISSFSLAFYWTATELTAYANQSGKTSQQNQPLSEEDELLRWIQTSEDETIENLPRPEETANDEGEPLMMLATAGGDQKAELRFDPFSPAIFEAGPGIPGGLPGEERDILDLVQLTGVISETNPKDNLAILRIDDPVIGSSLTAIKKSGESFSVENQSIRIVSVHSDRVEVKANGKARTLALVPYVEASTGSVQPSSSSSSGNAGTNARGANTPSTRDKAVIELEELE